MQQAARAERARHHTVSSSSGGGVQGALLRLDLALFVALEGRVLGLAEVAVHLHEELGMVALDLVEVRAVERRRVLCGEFNI